MNKINRKEEEICALKSQKARRSRTINKLRDDLSTANRTIADNKSLTRVAVSAAVRSAKSSDRIQCSSQKDIIRRKLNKAIKNEKVSNIACDLFVQLHIIGLISSLFI